MLQAYLCGSDLKHIVDVIHVARGCVLPDGTKIKPNFNAGIAFGSEGDTESTSHFDQTTSILYVLFGSKVSIGIGKEKTHTIG
jgi:hypothetical protein